MLGALVGGAVSLFGARKQRKQSQRQWEINRQDNLPQGIRDNAEAAGVNPLLLLGPGVGNGAGYQPTMGNEFATAGQIVTDASLALENQKIRRAELELENKRLEELVKANTLRPTTPGVYGGRNAGTNLADGNNRRNSGSASPTGFGSTGAKTGSHDPALDYKSPDYGVIKADGAGATSIVTNPGYVEHLGQFYGDEVADFEGALNYAKDWWYGQVKGDAYYPGWGWESQLKRPKSRPASVRHKARRSLKANTKTKEYRDHMRSAYPTVYD